jgi:hypothetical protein
MVIGGILLALWLRDRRAGNGVRVFPAMLALFAVLALPTFFVPQTAAWESFGRWLAGLPLP